jgi:hypothetical protein
MRRMRFACWITKSTNTHSQYEIFIAFPRQKLLHESTSVLRYIHIACLVRLYNDALSISCLIAHCITPDRKEQCIVCAPYSLTDPIQ